MTETEEKLIDCHCHLADKDFLDDIDQIVADAKEKGVGAALVVASCASEFQRVIDLADRYPDFILPCFGVHPVQGAFTEEQRCVTLKDLEEAVPWIEKYHERLGAIGEVGLDFQPRICKTRADKEVQKKVLIRQIELARKYNLPLNVHSRSSGRPTIALLREQGASRVLLHAFDGKASVAREGVMEGYFFSIPPSVIRSEQKQKLVRELPMEALLLETDSPALGPDKEERNVPGNIVLSCDYVASAKKLETSEVSKLTTRNALKLFPKLSKLIK
ncbi:hypothetical protein CHS0354_034592 [Potamilus streckersoni]|uniref:Uncharacterized protein n=1 Tax=Potamilus streckersoni TaxID=2493646 RepID=A0AAE0ST95_9BIVA|nr:hypothetical protein CHS0354_034592 [Potamilus streckersoni]